MEIKAIAKAKLSQISQCFPSTKNNGPRPEGSGILLVSEEGDKEFRIRLNEASICVELNVGNALENPKKEMLLKLFHILSECNWQYEISLSDIYGYIAESIANSQILYYSNSIKENNANEYSDIVLAKRIIDLRKRNAEFESKATILHDKLSRVAPDVIIARFGHESTISEIIEYTGLDKDEVHAVLGELPNLGYKVISQGGNKISVVKA